MMDTLAERLKQMTPLQRAVYALQETKARLDELERQRCEPIAIVGMACRFPGGAADPATFWRLLVDRVDAIREVPAERWDVDAFYDPDPAARGKMNTRHGGFLDRIEEFDNRFFGISDREAARIDPQQRLLLEVAWEALEDAGLPPGRLRGSSVGVFVGISLSDYGMMLSSDPGLTDAYCATGTSLCMAANRLSFLYGFQGPSLTLDTACSSSLVSVHLACQSLRNGEAELALAGGCSLLLSPVSTINLTKAGFSSPEGRVRAFDAAAGGYVRGEGVGLVVLKTLSAALRAGDPIYAVICGSAVNQNGASNGLTAPSGAAQERVLRQAYAQARVAPASVQFVEAQGTGTLLGDAIEAAALGRVLGENRPPDRPCAIGSVKTNIGHLEAASGIASLIKVGLALQHRQLPPGLHFQRPNPDISFSELGLKVQQSLEPWCAGDEPRTAGVSAFGFGGSNAHLVLQEVPDADRGPASCRSEGGDPHLGQQQVPDAARERPESHLLPLSARTEPALRELALRYIDYLSRSPAAWRDVCYTAGVRREHHDCRLAILADSPEQAADRLRELAAGQAAQAIAPAERGDYSAADVWLGRKPYGRELKVAFLFSGQPAVWSAHHAHFAGLHTLAPDAWQEIDSLLVRTAGWSLNELVADPAAWEDSARAVPSATALQLVLAAWWRHAGIAPGLVLGQGSGELAAAAVAGCLTPEEALQLAVAAAASPAGPSGDSLARPAALETTVTPRPARLPLLTAATEGPQRHFDLDTRRWRADAADSRLGSAISHLLQRTDVALELGPACLRDAVANGSADRVSPCQAIAVFEQPGAAQQHPPRLPRGIYSAESEAMRLWLLAAAGAIYAAGGTIDWQALAAEQSRCVRLPTYPWQRQRLWIDVRYPLASRPAAQATAPADASGIASQPGASQAATGSGEPPVRARPELNAPYAAPRTPLERGLAGAWAAVLRIDRVGLHDNFFELGGDSLLATILLHRLQQQFGPALPGHMLFQLQTVGELADYLRREDPGSVARRYPGEPWGEELPSAPQPEESPGLAQPEALPSATQAAESSSAEHSFPLSFSQERLWLLDQLDPGNPVYNIPLAMRLHGRLDPEILQRVLEEMQKRHDTLRTSIQSRQAGPVQVVGPASAPRLEIEDLAATDSAGAEAEAMRRAADDAARPFGLDQPPLYRCRLFRLGSEDHLLVVVMHHIISDGWSLGVLFREVAGLYAAFSRGLVDPLPKLATQYADYARWQRQHLQGEHLDGLLKYWSEQLGELPPLELPTDHPRPAQPSYRGARLRTVLPEPLAAAIRELARREQSTPFMTLLAAFFILLHRYSGQDDFAVGTPIAGRSQQEHQGLIGFFVNTLVLRADLSANPTFRQLLGRIRATALDAYQHQELPFERLVQALNPQRDTSRNPLFQVFFNMLQAETERLSQPGLVLESVQPWEPRSLFDLTLYAQPQAEGIELQLVYSTDLYDPPRMQILLQQYRRVLEQVVAAPDAGIEQLSLVVPDAAYVPPDPRQPLPAPQQEPITRTIASVAASLPDQVAIRQADCSWTYRQLWSAAECIGRSLLARGLPRGAAAAVTGPRSFGFVAALLGVARAGGVMLPLDPDLPGERRQRMLQEGDARVLIQVRGSGEGCCQDDGSAAVQPVPLGSRDLLEPECRPDEGAATVPRLDVRAEDARLEEASAACRDASVDAGESLPELSPQDPAYIFFTSGSTGRPKGILGTHAGLAHFLSWQRRQFQIGPRDRAAQLTALSFDVLLRDVFLPLTSGATLCLPDHADLVGYGSQLLAWLQREEITLLHCVPSLVRHWLRQGRPEQAYRGLRWAFSAGEPLTESLVRRWREIFPDCRIVNLYGPTETTLAKCFYVVPDPPSAGVQPVGQPLPQTQALVLRPDGQQCGVGEPGEIVIRTPFRTRGYLRDDDERSGRFFVNPYRDDRSDLLYRTADGGRYRPDGNLEILGRLDDQVKIRGVRIEPSEIAAVLDRHPAVQTSAVLAHRRDGGEYVLVAYVVPSTSRPAEAAEGAVCPASTAGPAEGIESVLRNYLGERLPPAMVPAAVMVLLDLPLLANGKVDRRALPLPDLQAASDRPDYVPPRTPTEKQLAALWSQVLDAGRVGVSDNFFALGGHSLLAVQLASQIRDMFHVDVPLRELFQRPTVGQLAAFIDAGSADGAAGSLRTLARIPREGDLPVSFAQQRFWFLDQLQPGNPLYNMAYAGQLSGPLDLDAARRTFRELVARHEAFRTSFATVDGRPVQRIAAEIPDQLQVIDLSRLEQAEQDAEVRQYLRTESLRPFDLSRGPLFRVLLLRLAEQEHVLIIVLHHIIGDAWSRRVFTAEMIAVYDAFRRGLESPLPELPIQYVDFAAWQRHWLEGERLEGELAWWRQRLEGLAPLELPTDRPRAAARGAPGSRRMATLPPAVVDRVNELSRSAEVTPFVVYLAAFSVLLQRYSRQHDLAISSTIANRNHSGTEGVIGFFVNTVVLRADLSGDPTVAELLGRWRETTLGALDHQDVPFERLVEDLNPPRELGRNPLSQVMVNFPGGRFNLADAPQLGIQAGPVRADQEDHAEGPAANEAGPFDLALTVVEWDDGLRIRLGYNTGLYEGETIERMLAQFECLLEALLADPQQRVSDLPLIGADEQREMLTRWNDTAHPYPGDRGVHECFEAQAASTPAAVAVVDGPRQWTYRELNARANQIAHALLERGVAAEQIVGVHMPRCAELIATLLGVLKAGGAYLPLDPQAPADRLNYMLEDAGVALIVTRGAVPKSLPSGVAEVLDVDAELPYLSGLSPENPLPRAAPGGLAYVIYTSGSTGRPKGVMIEHRALANYTYAAVREYEIHRGDRILQFNTFTYDGHVEEVYPCLVRGAALILRSEDLLDSFQTFLDRCRQWQLTVVSIPTGLWHELVGHLASAGGQLPETLRLALIGGERARPERVHQWFTCVGDRVRLLNTYGPTETTVVATSACLRPADGHGERVAIGRPLANMRAYALDDRQRPLPAGVVGELYIGGDSVGRGYLNQPGLTAERFLPDPFAQPGGRMFRTGDLVRWRSDGRLEFLGRADQQVKLRGFRIEPGEVEQVLQEHPLVARAAVAVFQRQAGDVRLAAYVVPHAPGGVPMVEIRRFLAARLPDYMVPSAFVELARLPMTDGGKVDRQALPEPDWTAAALRDQFVAPRSATERRVAEIWRDILNVDQVGVHDSFFDLGGNSLLAVRLTSRIRSEFAIELPLATLFAAPRLGEFSERIQAARSASASTVTPPIRPRTSRGPAPLAFPQEPFWLLEKSHPRNPALNIHGAVPLAGELNIPALEAAIREIVRRHEILRTRFADDEQGEGVQIVEPALQFDLPVEDLTGMPAAERQQKVTDLARQEASTGFDLRQLPLFRARLLRLAPDEYTLLLTIHHIAFDGWSLQVLLREVALLYEAFAAGQPSPLPPLPVQYADFALWQREYLQGQVLESLRGWWLEQLNGLVLPELPTDRPWLPDEEHVKASHSFLIPAALAARLSDLGHAADATPFVVHLAAFKTLLHGYCGQDDLTVLSPTANRRRGETEPAIGLFMGSTVLRTDLSGDPPFDQLLVRVRRTVLEALDHQEMPIELLVRELMPNCDRRRYPVARTMLTYHQRISAEEVRHSPGLQLGHLPVDREPSLMRFVFTLALTEGEQGVYARLKYDRSLYRPETVQRIGEHYLALLAAVADGPGRRLSELPRPRLPLSEQVPGDPGPLAVARPLAQPGNTGALVLLHNGAAGAPLFCIHGLGGHVASFLPLAAQLARPMYGLQALGLDAGTRPQECILEMAALYAAEIRTLQPRGPYLLAGWSLGGVIAWEVARQLEAAGQQVALLALFDTRLPSGGRGPEQIDDRSVLRRIGPQLGLSERDWQGLPPEELWERIAERAERAPGLGAEEIQRLAAVCRAQLAAAARYQPQPYPGPVVLFRAAQGSAGADSRWNQLCPHLQVETVPGDHYSMLRSPAVEALAERLSSCLRAACARLPAAAANRFAPDRGVSPGEAQRITSNDGKGR